MRPLTREAVERILGPVDEAALAEIALMGANAEELEEAQRWIANEGAMWAAGRPPPSGRVARLVEWLELEPEPETGF